MTEDVTAFALFALDHAAGSVVPQGGPLIPFSMTRDGDGKVNLARFVAEVEEAQAQARAHVRAASGITQALVAWDGYLTLEGRRMDAVFVEASGEGDEESVIFAQRYRRTGLRRRWQIFENPVALPGTGALLASDIHGDLDHGVS
jgi:hypothetical protein